MLLLSCDSSIEQLQNLPKPCTVYAKYKAGEFNCNEDVFVIKSADNRLHSLNRDRYLKALIEKYNVGDTIN